MGVLDNLRGRQESVATHVVAPAMEDTGVKVGNEGGENGYTSNDNSSHLSLEERNEKEVITNANNVTDGAQLGVKKAEAAALVWTKKAVYATYAWIWICFFMLALQQSILSNVNYLAYANFSAAPEVSTAYILSSVIGGVLRLPIAKVLNIWGRAEGFLVFIVVYLVGMIIIAASNGPDSYAAGYVIYWIGYDALYFIMDVFIADTSGLKNRAFAFAFASTPFICTAFTGPLAAQSFLKMTSWRWAVGAFCIIQFFVFMPLVVVFKYYQRKAEKQGLFTSTSSGRTRLQSFIHYFHEFDIVGAALLIAAFVLFLLPFSLTSYSRASYSSGTFIAEVVIGVLLFPAFALWEKYLARTHFVRWELFKKRTVLGACMMAAVAYYSFYAWDVYYYNFVMVVYDLNISMAGYMSQIYNVGSCFWGVVFGVYVRLTKHFKYACLCFGLPLLMLGSGLMIRFRGNDANIGFIVMCQIFVAFGGGQLVIGNQMAVMAASDRDGVPMMLALLGLCNNLGGAVGQAVAAAVYQNTFVKGLASKLPADAGVTAADLSIGGYTTQMNYPQGSPIRQAINYAWGYSQKYNCVSSTCFLALGFIGIGLWKNYNVDRKQNKGNVM